MSVGMYLIHPLMPSVIAALLKVILLVVGSVSTHLTCTPPNASPTKDERSKYTNRAASRIGDNGSSMTRSVLTAGVSHVTSYSHCFSC